ncbi:hypothetical protein RJ640_022121 [Escallonia rubra]|uniref:Protein NO VEIN C-terminal domain-containing protein n=1 Tax=Escallonia rubra TaxID=112253 RepID=A0AA88RY61_9ASTE|nr:hypothetical protein RJ640_022121 [Escallonia rubra]
MQQVPSLHHLIVTEGKINAFIHCFVGVRRITSLHDLELAICKNEGVQHFEELELGPLVRHPLVAHYFGTSSDLTEVFRITSEEIISCLVEFMDANKGKEIEAVELLDFIGKKRSVKDREKLGIRIQSLGATLILVGEELDHLILTEEITGDRSLGNFGCSKMMVTLRSLIVLLMLPGSIIILAEWSLREQFDRGLERLRWQAVREDVMAVCLSVKHNWEQGASAGITIVRESCNQGEFGLLCFMVMHITQIGQARRSENTALKKCLEGWNRNSGTKRKKRPLFSSQKKQMDDHFSVISQRVSSFSVASGESSGTHLRFVSSSSEDEMDNSDDEEEKGVGNDARSMFSSQNVDSSDRVSSCPYPSAVEEMTRLGLNSEMDAGPSPEHHGPPSRKKRKSEKIIHNIPGRHKLSKRDEKADFCRSTDNKKKGFDNGNEVDLSLSSDSLKMFVTTWKEACRENSVPEVLERMLQFYKARTNVMVEDILKKMSSYLELDFNMPGDTNPEKKLTFLRKFSKCEFWLAEQFSVKEFESLGHGDFFLFIEKHVCQLPEALQKWLAGERRETLSLDACMFQNQLAVLISQASNSVWENENVSKQNVSELLKRQFPSLCSRLVGSCPVSDFLDVLREKKSMVVSKSVLFSATLFGTFHDGHPLAQKEKCLGGNAVLETHIDDEAGNLGSLTTKDALEVLIKAPMLIDLDLWSHWDLIFAPSLGPLVEWLLNDVNTKELLCLVTKSGKVMRVNHLATTDTFLDSFLRGSSFRTAVELLSLFALYGGKRHIPLALLKCHARQAFEVIVKNCMEMERNEGQKFSNLISKSNKSESRVNKAVHVASKFILHCLDCLPVEFRAFAADILLSGLRSVLKEAPSAILNECEEMEQRLMVHDIGLSLGIVEWINDFHAFCSPKTTDLQVSSGASCLEMASNASEQPPSPEGDMIISFEADRPKECKGVSANLTESKASGGRFGDDRLQHLSKLDKDNDPVMVIESIRQEEFGLDPSHSAMESSMLNKQHARLGRALHCLSQELYSQDSHFLLELVQNADDNTYLGNVEPTLTCILLEWGIVVLNNELGFSAENIRALCDVGNSTKKGSTAGYIGKKGIGFKSVFRVSDAPEIHSNGFHIKFDISEGEIGFVLPTVVPPCDIDMFSRLVSVDIGHAENNSWNTCIVLPFRSKFSEGFAMKNVISMFSDLHPSLLLFLHRLQCIKFRNLLSDSFIVMKKEVLGGGIVNVSVGKEKMSWLVVSHILQANGIRPDVQSTEISVAFTLQESCDGNYIPNLEHQPVFAFLPLRTYGLKFILQGDFILPSSREEVTGDSPWNQWLLSEFPSLFVGALKSFHGLSCFKEKPGKAVSTFMSFVPLVGEVHGFFASLPRMIISKLRMANCLLLEGDNNELVPPCKVLRSWTEEVRSLLPDSLLHEHLGLGFLNKDIVLSDTLAEALGIEEYGPKILLQVVSSLSRMKSGLRSMGLGWLSSWLNAIYLKCAHSPQKASQNVATEPDFVDNLRKIPFIPLLDGKYGSLDEGTIWLHSDALSTNFDNEFGPEAFPKLYGKLRIVNPVLFNTSPAVNRSINDESVVENITRMLYLIGVQRLSAHDILKVHILPTISDESNIVAHKDLMTEYLSFAMFHLQSSCSNCCVEREYLISELRTKALILTNYGHKRPLEVSIHFSEDFGNPINVKKLIDGIDVKWHEVDISYLKHPITKSVSGAMLKWRIFFQELGVTDFVQVVQTEKRVKDIPHLFNSMMWDMDMISSGTIAKDWESQELVHLLSKFTSRIDQERCKYLLEVFDTLWDDNYSNKITGYCNISSTGESKTFKSSFISILHDIRWIASSMDDELHFPKEVFHNCEAVCSILGPTAPYAVPKVRSEKLLTAIGFRAQVTLDDNLSLLKVWRRSEAPFSASISQMSKFFTFIWSEMTTSKQKIAEILHPGGFIFVPHTSVFKHEDVVAGAFFSPQEVYWHDSIGSVDQMKVVYPCSGPAVTPRPCSKMLCNIYPGLHDFFVNECGVNETPLFCDYLQILLQLSSSALPSQAANIVFKVLLKWSDGSKSGLLSSEDIEYLKECLSKVEFVVVTREAIYYGPADCSLKTSLVNWALPYAQRYLHNVYPDKYSELKQSGFENLSRLRIIVVEKLFYRNVIKRADIASKKRFESNCLSQGNILYVTQESDTHSIFMEMSGLFLNGTSELHMANFLHMITTMAESGSTEEQTEFFILNSQKVPKLPEDEAIWSLSSVPSSAWDDETLLTSYASALTDEPDPQMSKRKPCPTSNWPPVNWKSAPGFSFSRTNGLRSQAIGSVQMRKGNDDENFAAQTNVMSPIEKTAPGFSFAGKDELGQMRNGSNSEEYNALTNPTVEISADWMIEDDLAATMPAMVLQDCETTEYHPERVLLNPVDLGPGSDGTKSSYSNYSERDQLSIGTSNPEQAIITGRLGELVAFKYFAGKVGETSVKWVNESKETGLPYDIVVGDKKMGREYIEVKATKYARKDWFIISVREWQFAVEKGESYSIARVVLLGNNKARVTIYKNPAKLCQLRQLQLAVVMQQQEEFAVVA